MCLSPGARRFKEGLDALTGHGAKRYRRAGVVGGGEAGWGNRVPLRGVLVPAGTPAVPARPFWMRGVGGDFVCCGCGENWKAAAGPRGSAGGVRGLATVADFGMKLVRG